MSEKYNLLLDLNKESFIFDFFRLIPSSAIKYNGRFFKCSRIERLLKCPLYKKSWIDSSKTSKPDYHNDKHHLLTEFMRIDDCVNEINGEHVNNSFERQTKYMESHYGRNYKEYLKSCILIFNADTRDYKGFNFKGYLKNFERVVLHHAERADSYRRNFPNCDALIFFICDESNCYYQPNKDKECDDNHRSIVHNCFLDKAFLNVIKKSKADFVVWFTINKTILNNKNKVIKQPLAFIYDVNHLKHNGINFDHSAMIKVK